MEFISWHYTTGLSQYLKRWYFLVSWVVHFFSLTLLLPTLFSPWKRLTDDEDSPGFSFDRYFRQLTFNLISRGIGAIVRLTLLLTGLLVLIPSFLIGLIGLMFWIVIPVIGLPYYLLSDKHHQRLFGKLHLQLLQLPTPSQITAIFTSSPGKFVLSRSGVSLDQLLELVDARVKLTIPNAPPSTFQEFIQLLLSAEVWPESALKKHHLNYSDLLYSAVWWDEVYHSYADPTEDELRFSRSGLGLELLFGYTPQLNKYSTDLSVMQNFTHHLIGREQVVSQMERILTSGNSLVLIGEPGVGKRTIVLELARKAMTGELDSQLVYKRFLELDYNFLLSDNLDINQKKAHLSQILSESSAAGNVILVIKDLHRLTHPDVEGLDFTDLFETHLSKRKLKIIAISSQMDFERFLLPNSRLRKHLLPVEAQSVSKDSARLILFDYLFSQEKLHKVFFTIQAVTRILDGSEDYISDTPFPEKSLELSDQVIALCKKKGVTEITVDHINEILTEITGISLTHLTSNQKNILLELESRIHSQLIGQDLAVTLIAKSLRARDMGVKNPNRPIGSFIFLGPTGVGKTQTAKTLADIYFGSSDVIIRFDMAEFAGADGFSRLVGARDSNRPGLLPTAIRNRPASLLLLDEIEKSPPEIFNLFLTLLDEGQFTDSYGKKVSCRHLFVIATSNAGAEFIRQQVNLGLGGDQLQTKVLEEIQRSGRFSPEFLNRFDGVIVYQPLSPTDLIQIANLQLTQLATRLKSQNIYLQVTPEACEHLAKLGYQPEYGARPMRRLVDLTIGDIIASALLKEDVKSGDSITLVPNPDQPYFTLHVQPA